MAAGKEGVSFRIKDGNFPRGLGKGEKVVAHAGDPRAESGFIWSGFRSVVKTW